MRYDPNQHPFGMMRLSFSSPEERADYEENKAHYNQQIRSFNSAASQNAKQASCVLCGKPCSSFCNSHSIPQFALRRIAENGKVVSPLQNELPAMGTDFGVRKAGVFHLICHDCDNTVFQQYETPEAYINLPTDQMLAQIAIKDLLQMISKRNEERELFKLLGDKFPAHQGITNEKIRIGDFDLQEFRESLDYARKALSSNSGTHYYLCYYRLLDYVVPYTTQAAITMVSDFEDSIINNLYSKDPSYELKDIYVAVFPLETTSAVMMFIKEGEARYRKFYRQLKKLSEDDQLAAINYIVFSYTENVFLNPGTHQQLKENQNFIDVCAKSTEYLTEIPFLQIDPLSVAVEEFSLSHRHEIPNLLSREYALKI